MQQLSFFTPEQYDKIKPFIEFVDTCNISQATTLINYILYSHTAYAFNPTDKLLLEVELACVNGECIQFNLEEYER